MQAILDNTRGLSLLATLNWDRAFHLGTVLASLLAGAWIGTLGLN